MQVTCFPAGHIVHELLVMNGGEGNVSRKTRTVEDVDEFTIEEDEQPIAAAAAADQVVVAKISLTSQRPNKRKRRQQAIAGGTGKRKKKESVAQAAPRPKSGFYGVCAHGSKWQAQICYGGKQHSLGSYRTKEEAAAAYDAAAREHKGDAAVCNFESAEAGAAAAAASVSAWEQQRAPQA